MNMVAEPVQILTDRGTALRGVEEVRERPKRKGLKSKGGGKCQRKEISARGPVRDRSTEIQMFVEPRREMEWDKFQVKQTGLILEIKMNRNHFRL